MPEAVIVATARSPIGRAFKGSLVDFRPDDIAATIIRAALDKVPALDPHTVDDLIMGCGLPGGEQGFNIGRVVAVKLGLDDVPGTTITRYCSSLAAVDPDGVPRDQGRRGRRLHQRRRRDGVAVRQGQQRLAAGHPEPGRSPTRRRASAKMAEGDFHWTDPREDGQPARRLHRDGPDRRERRRDQERLPRGAGRVRRPVAEPRREGDRERLLRARDHAGRRSRTAPRSRRTTARAPASPLEGVSGLKPVFRPDGTVTAGNCCPLNDGAAAVIIMSDTKAKELGLTPLARIVSTGVSGLQPGDHGPRPGRGDQDARSRSPARRSTTSTSSRSTRRSPRRSSRRRGRSASTRSATSSTSTAARSRWATRSA